MSRGGPDDISVAYLISPITLTPRCLRPVTYHRLYLRYFSCTFSRPLLSSIRGLYLPKQAYLSCALSYYCTFDLLVFWFVSDKFYL